MDKEVEIKQLRKFPNYLITNDGRIWSKNVKRWLKPWVPLAKKYISINLSKKGINKTKEIHRLVLETFVGPCPKGMEACHNNGNRLDNRLENLRWDTRSNNRKDSVKQGTWSNPTGKGEKNGRAKLREQDVRMIIYIYKARLFSQLELANLYGIGETTVGHIIYKRSWRHLWNTSP